jgi:hypothetical protein
MASRVANAEHTTRPLRFEMHINEGHAFRSIIEVLSASLRRTTLQFLSDGLHIIDEDKHHSVVFDIHVSTVQRYLFESPQCIGIAMDDLSKTMRNIRRNDAITMFADDDDYFKMRISNFRTGTSQNQSTSLTSIRYQLLSTSQIESFETADGAITYPEMPIVIDSSNFHRMIRDMQSIADVVQVRYQAQWIEFHCKNANAIIQRDYVFGHFVENAPVCKDMYRMSLLSQMIRLNNIGQKLRVSVANHLPMRICCTIGSIGEMKIYLRSNDYADRVATLLKQNT